ncbi:IS110 family transposase [Sinorhizobium psoraleae]|uniref:IS110 family transposase n=1 Tax=Sinorhizobium psoraleae TaxID=520838 RepID=UPI0035E3EA25
MSCRRTDRSARLQAHDKVTPFANFPGLLAKVDDVFSQTFPTQADALAAAQIVARQHELPGSTENIEFQDSAGHGRSARGRTPGSRASQRIWHCFLLAGAAFVIGSFKLLAGTVRGVEETGLPKTARDTLEELVQQIERLSERIRKLDHEIAARANRDDDMRRLMTIPGVGPLIAAAVKVIAPDPSGFNSARHFAAWIGLTPKSHSSGGKVLLGRISKWETRNFVRCCSLGRLQFLVPSKTTVRWYAGQKRLRERRPFKVAAVAVASKLARIVWALLVRGGAYARSQRNEPRTRRRARHRDSNGLTAHRRDASLWMT